MTDKKTGSTDKDFDLNHFDQAGEAEREEANAFVETESFYTADLFADAERPEPAAEEEKADPFDATWGADRFAELGYGKKEPSIPQKAESATDPELPIDPELDTDKDKADPQHEKQPEIPDSEAEQPAITTQMPPMADSLPTAPPSADQRSATKPITLFAILAMLVAAIAVWLNPGAKSNSDDAIRLKAQPVLAADVQTQRLEARIVSLEQQSSQQNETLKQQIEKLQQQVSRLSSQLAKQSRKNQQTRQPITKAVKQKPAKPHASTRPVSTSPMTGWVVNLVSVDSRHAAAKAQKRYKARSISAEIFPTNVKGKMWYRLRISGFASKQEAIAQKKYLASKHGIKDAWVQKP